MAKAKRGRRKAGQPAVFGRRGRAGKAPAGTPAPRTTGRTVFMNPRTGRAEILQRFKTPEGGAGIRRIKAATAG